jgi:hypothetical protein
MLSCTAIRPYLPFRERVRLHNEHVAATGAEIDVSILNFAANWDVSRPVVVPMPGARGGLAADRLAGAVSGP